MERCFFNGMYIYILKNFSFIRVQIWNDVHKHINVSMSTQTYYLYNNFNYIVT